jgi:DNA mismatch endonuclease (patch repair protein)
MPDQFDLKKHSEIMAKVHSSNTTPEKIAYGVFEEMGFTFSLQAKELSGKPDMFLPDYDTVLFVHGCFWHGCPVCKHAK